MTERCPLCHNTGRYPSQYTPGLVLICTRCEAGGRVAREEGERMKRGMADSAGIARAPAAPQDATGGWVVADADGARFRRWGDWGPVWTGDVDAALQFARREDAEAFAADDEDAWKILPVGQQRRRLDDVRDPGRAAAVAVAIYGTALVVVAGCLFAFGLALRAGWVVLA